MSAFDEGLVRQHLNKCQAVATKYQMRHPMDLGAEASRIAQDAWQQARALGPNGASFLAKLKGRLKMQVHVTEMPEPQLPNKLTDPTLNTAGRAAALKTISVALESV